METTAPFAAPVLQPLIDRGVIAGAVVLAADREGIRAVEALGFADLGALRPMTDDALFWIASTSKAFAGTLVAMLIEEGKLHPDDPVEKYLPEFEGQMMIAERTDDAVLLRKPARRITLRDCLTHTSGLPFGTALETPARDRLPLALAVRSYTMLPLLSEPGTTYLYSNAGTNVAARLVEVAAGQPFEGFLQERLLDPLGLRDTTFWPDDAQVARLARTYALTGTDAAPGELREMPVEQVTHPLTDRVRRYGLPAGGLFSTARDVAQLGRLVANGGTLDGRRYLDTETVRAMTARHTPPSVAEWVGYLWKGDDGFRGHGGAYRNQFSVDLETGVTFVLILQSVGAGGPQIDEASRACRRAAVARFGR